MSLNIRHWLAERQIELAVLARQAGRQLPHALVASVAFRIVRDMEVKSLTPFDISALAEVLELPLGAASLAIEPIAQLSVWLLRILSRKKPLKRNEGTWLTFQVAYLNALKGILEQESHLRRPWLDRAIDFANPVDFASWVGALNPESWETIESPDHPKFNPFLSRGELGGSHNPKSNNPKSNPPLSRGGMGESHNPKSFAPTLDDQQLIALLKTLRTGRLSDSQAEQALSLVGESFLVQQMNNTAVAWFIANGAEETEAKLLTQRLVWGLPGYLLAVIAENAQPLAQLTRFVRLTNVGQASRLSVGATGGAGFQLDNQFAGNNENSSEFPVLNAQSTESSTLSTQNYPFNLERENYRAKLLQALGEPLLAEIFALKDIYVPLKGMPVGESVGPVFGETHAKHKTDPTAKTGAASSLRAKPVDLMEWAWSQLEDTTSMAVIEGDPGCGKTSFCQMLAERVAQELYPRWLPVLIRLRDAKLGQTLEQTLDTAFPLGRFSDRDGWLSQASPPCLVILDGFDELPRSAHTGSHLQAFLDQLVQFHRRNVAACHGTPRHKFLITARGGLGLGNSVPLGGIRGNGDWQLGKTSQSPIPEFHWVEPGEFVNMARIVIQPMEQDEFRQWFQNWSKIQSKSIAQGYFTFLKQAGVFRNAPQLKELAALIRQPLMLYLLGVLHRDGLLDHSIFHLNDTQLKFEIYDRVCHWLLASPNASGAELPHVVREGLAHASRSPEAIANLLQDRTPQVLRHQMQVAALTILQSGQHQVPQAVVQSRLSPPFGRRDQLGVMSDSPPFGRSDELGVMSDEWKNSFTQNSGTHPVTASTTQYSPRHSTLNTQHSLLPGLFFRSLEHTIEFSHPNLGEYLCAQEIAQQLKTLTLQGNHGYGEATFAIDSASAVAEHIYGLLGYGVLSTELEDYVVERLQREEARAVGSTGFGHTRQYGQTNSKHRQGFSLSVLFERLYRFYIAYCRGRWLDEGIAHQAWRTQSLLSNPLNVLQLDAAVGLNVFLLLCACARVAQIPLWPCGDPKLPLEFDPNQLLTLIGRTDVLSPMAFWQRMCYSQSTAKVAGLSRVQLNGACLNHAMLKKANLWQANLSFASLIGSDLSGANLQQANLSWANLAGANLFGANLSGARLEGANLSGANLLQSNLTLANLTNACLYEAGLDEETKNMGEANKAFFSLEEFGSYLQSLRHRQDQELVPDNDFLLTNEEQRLIESAEGEPILPEPFHSQGTGEQTLGLEYPTPGKLVSPQESESYDEGETAMLENPRLGNI